jgi:hypothetical protein
LPAISLRAKSIAMYFSWIRRPLMKATADMSSRKINSSLRPTLRRPRKRSSSAFTRREPVRERRRRGVMQAAQGSTCQASVKGRTLPVSVVARGA